MIKTTADVIFVWRFLTVYDAICHFYIWRRVFMHYLNASTSVRGMQQWQIIYFNVLEKKITLSYSVSSTLHSYATNLHSWPHCGDNKITARIRWLETTFLRVNETVFLMLELQVFTVECSHTKCRTVTPNPGLFRQQKHKIRERSEFQFVNWKSYISSHCWLFLCNKQSFCTPINRQVCGEDTWPTQAELK